MMDRTSDGRALRLLTILDEYTRECLSVVVGRRLTAQDVLDELYRLFLTRGTPPIHSFGQRARIYCQGGERLVT